MNEPIAEYLADLERALTGSECDKANVLDEVEDHLRESARAALLSGIGDARDAERLAVQFFVPPKSLARALPRQASRDGTFPAAFALSSVALLVSLGLLVAGLLQERGPSATGVSAGWAASAPRPPP